MLTRQLAIAEYDFRRGRLLPDRLTRGAHGGYVDYAERMLSVYRIGVGRTRRELHRAVRHVFADEEGCPTRRIDAFCKLLDDASDFDGDRKGRAAKLRQKVFRLAAPHHPLVERADRLFERQRSAMQSDIAAQLGRSWQQIEQELFSDVIEFHRLVKFDGYDSPQRLLARYNVAQVQAALFGAVHMTVWASSDFKTILRYAKLARLMHTITRDGLSGYRLRLDGPASVLRQTRRYGAAMARFLPALVACRQWRMHALVEPRRGAPPLSLDLTSADGLNSHLPPPEDFDSQVEQAFAEKWGTDRREGWLLERETEILHQGQKVFLPDFVFRHDDGRKVLLEIVGFWTPEYLQAKLQTLHVFRDRRILLAISQQASEPFAQLGHEVVRYKSALSVKDVLARLHDYGEEKKGDKSN
ncbi:MAG: DUF790 family protein [Planctomycetes bacterium]|nr:DUF790 family protein [Planctomycetota bacterium]